MTDNSLSKCVELDQWAPYFDGGSGSKVLLSKGLLPESKVYHRLQWNYAKAVFQHRRLRLSPIQAWPDPYEEWSCRALFGRDNASLFGVNAYALCFTKSRYDEPAWRMVGYGRTEPIVRLSFSVPGLLAAASKALVSQPGSWFFGPVRYCQERSFKSIASKLSSKGAIKEVGRTAASILLWKRRAFRFEKEVRMIFLDRNGALPKDEVFLPIDLAVISDVMVSPYNRESFPMIKRDLAKFGITPRKSGVLSTPAWMVGSGQEPKGEKGAE